jgi:hypothetical protein
VRQGHEVTLFASGDSRSAAKLVRCCDVALWLNPNVCDPMPYHILMMEEVRKQSNQFDIVHFHIDFLQALLAHAQGSDANYCNFFHVNHPFPHAPEDDLSIKRGMTFKKSHRIRESRDLLFRCNN